MLLPQALCVPERQVVAWFASSEPRHFLPSSFPVFVLQDSEGYYYGFPEFGAPGGRVVGAVLAGVVRLSRRLLLS